MTTNYQTEIKCKFEKKCRLILIWTLLLLRVDDSHFYTFSCSIKCISSCGGGQSIQIRCDAYSVFRRCSVLSPESETLMSEMLNCQTFPDLLSGCLLLGIRCSQPFNSRNGHSDRGRAPTGVCKSTANQQFENFDPNQFCQSVVNWTGTETEPLRCYNLQVSTAHKRALSIRARLDREVSGCFEGDIKSLRDRDGETYFKRQEKEKAGWVRCKSKGRKRGEEREGGGGGRGGKNQHTPFS